MYYYHLRIGAESKDYSKEEHHTVTTSLRSQETNKGDFYEEYFI